MDTVIEALTLSLLVAFGGTIAWAILWTAFFVLIASIGLVVTIYNRIRRLFR